MLIEQFYDRINDAAEQPILIIQSNNFSKAYIIFGFNFLNTILNYFLFRYCMIILDNLKCIFYLILFLQIEQSMQFYSITKYENITDRIKRLANNTNEKVSSGSFIQNNEIKRTPFVGVNRYDKPNKEFLNQPKLDDRRQRYQPSSNQISQNNYDKYASSHLNQIISKRENLNTSRQITEKKPIYGRNIEYNKNYQEPMEKIQQKAFAKEQCLESQSPKTFTKIKSDSNLKIQEILQSYNNYKSNKQKFLSTLNKSSAKDSRQAKFEKNQKSQQNEGKVFVKNNKIFEQIDNIWNQGDKEDKEYYPRFQRSKNKAMNYQNGIQTNQFSKGDSFKESQNDPKSFSKQKISLKVEVYNVERCDKSLLSAIISPRGNRVPGKICKNNDKTYCGIQKYI